VIDTKLLDSEKAKEYHQREKDILSSLNHQNIVGLHDILESNEEGDGQYIYFVMEFCQGGSLDRYIKGTPLKEQQARRILSQIGKSRNFEENSYQSAAEAFKYLSSKSIVHRDLNYITEHFTI
jgi:serine/threonine protein kinase